MYTNQTDKAKGDALKGFLSYILTDGQDLANDVDYAELPDGLQAEGHRPARQHRSAPGHLSG